MYYTQDFFSLDGTGLLQTTIQSIIDNGDTPVFRGFFWFQGESDTGGSDDRRTNYGTRFLGMLSQLSSDIDGAGSLAAVQIAFTLAIVDGDADNYPVPWWTSLETIEVLRQAQMDLADGSPVGSYVDTRGMERQDFLHLTNSERVVLGAQMANAFIAPVPATLPLFLSALAFLGFVAFGKKLRAVWLAVKTNAAPLGTPETAIGTAA